MTNPVCIKNSRQERALKVLLEKDSIQVKDMGPIIGSLNPRQTISELRQQGFHDVIVTRRFKVRDRDGKNCRPGEYCIPQEKKPIARQALDEYAASTSPNVSAADKNEQNLIEGV